MNPRTDLLLRAMHGLRQYQTLHELSYRIGLGGRPADFRECQAIMEEASQLVVDLQDALLAEMTPAMSESA